MRRQLARALTTGATVVAAAALTAVTASAAPQTIRIDNPNADGHIAGYSDHIALINEANGLRGTCDSTGTTKASTFTGTVDSGTYTLPDQAGSLDDVTFNNCQGPLGSATVDRNGLPYDVTFTSYNSSTDVAKGYLSGIDIHVTMSICEFDVVGRTPLKYTVNNGTGTLTMLATSASASQLTAQNVSLGCIGVVSEGDPFSFTATYTVTDPANPPLTVSLG